MITPKSHRLKYYVTILEQSKCVHPVDFSYVIRVHENSQYETNKKARIGR